MELVEYSGINFELRSKEVFSKAISLRIQVLNQVVVFKILYFSQYSHSRRVVGRKVFYFSVDLTSIRSVRTV